MDQNTQNTPQQVELGATSPKKSVKRRWFLVGIAVVVVGVIAGIVLYIMWLNSSEKLLADSLRNTLALQQTTYKVTYSSQAKDSSGLTSLTLDGKYNKSQGYGMTASTISTTGTDEAKLDADIVFDTAGNGYYNYTNISSTAANSLQAQEFSAFLQSLKGTGEGVRWIKAPAGAPQQNTACVLVGLQKMQNDAAAEQALVAALVKSGGIAITASSSTGNTAVYDLKATANKVDALVKAYQGSNVYKALTTCSTTGYSLTPSAALQSDVRVTIDKKARLIKAVTVTYRVGSGTATIDFTVASTQGVTVTVPKPSQIITTPSAVVPVAQ